MSEREPLYDNPNLPPSEQPSKRDYVEAVYEFGKEVILYLWGVQCLTGEERAGFLTRKIKQDENTN